MSRPALWPSQIKALLPVSAQVEVEVTQDQDQFLPAEALATVAQRGRAGS